MESSFVSPYDFELKFRSKKDLYYILTNELGYFLPKYRQCSMEFLRSFLKGDKIALKASECCMIPVPFYEELSASNMWEFIKEVPDLIKYFPDFPEHVVPDRTYLFTILSTLKGDELKKLIKNAHNNRAIGNEDDNDKLIEVRNDIKDEIFSILNKKTTKGRANFLLKKGALLKPRRAVKRKYDLNLSVLKEQEENKEREERKSRERSIHSTPTIEMKDANESRQTSSIRMNTRSNEV